MNTSSVDNNGIITASDSDKSLPCFGDSAMLLKVSDVAERLNLSQSKIYALVESGRLPHFRIGGAIRFDEEQLQAFLETCKVGNPPRMVHSKKTACVRGDWF